MRSAIFAAAVLAASTLVSAPALAQEIDIDKAPSAPTPRLPMAKLPDGKVDRGRKGVWAPIWVLDWADKKYVEENIDVPFTPTGFELYKERQANHSKDDPEGCCLPAGVPRHTGTPYPFQLIQLPDRVVVLDEGARVAGSRGQGVDIGQQEIETVKIADGVFVLMAGPAQGNILVSAGSDGIFLVDTMYAPMHDKIMAALGKISDKPVRYVVNTHVHGDHTAGNAAMAKLGALIISQDNMLKRMPAQPTAGLPVLTYSDSLTLHFNGEEIYIYHPAPAHTDGDSIIYFRHANVMHVGDVPASLRFNNIGVNEGGSVNGMIAAGEQVMKIANENTKIVPGHLGPVIGFKEIQQQLVMFRAVRDRVLSAIRAGKTMEEVVASKPTADFDQGRMGGAITNDRFVRLVYTDLARRN